MFNSSEKLTEKPKKTGKKIIQITARSQEATALGKRDGREKGGEGGSVTGVTQFELWVKRERQDTEGR